MQQSISVALYDVLVKEPNIANIYVKNDKIADLILTFNENGQLYKQLRFCVISVDDVNHSSTFNIMRTTFLCKNAILKIGIEVTASFIFLLFSVCSLLTLFRYSLRFHILCQCCICSAFKWSIHLYRTAIMEVFQVVKTSV